MAAKQPSYAEAYDKAKQAYAKAQLADPESHFPHKTAEKLEWLRSPPEEGTNNHPAHWYTSEAIIEAGAAYVEAQEALLQVQADGGPAEEVESARLREREAARALDEARAQHRRGRPIAPVAVAGSPQDIEERNSAIRALAAAGHTAEAISRLTGRPLAEIQGALAGRED